MKEEQQQHLQTGRNSPLLTNGTETEKKETPLENETLQLREERLRVEKKIRVKENIIVSKRKVEEIKKIEVPVKTEEMVITERKLIKEEDGNERWTEKVTVIPVKKERIRITKRIVLVEEVHIIKKAVTEMQRVEVKLKKEELVVEKKTATADLEKDEL